MTKELVGGVLFPVDIVQLGMDLCWKPRNDVAGLGGTDAIVDAVEGVLLEGFELGRIVHLADVDVGISEEALGGKHAPAEHVDGWLGMVGPAVDANTEHHMINARYIDTLVVGPFEQRPDVVEVATWKALYTDIWVIQLGDVAHVGITDDQDRNWLSHEDPLSLVVARMLVEALVRVDPVSPVLIPTGRSGTSVA